MLDTSVLVAALRSAEGASRWLLLEALQDRLDILASVPLFLEYESVLKRPDQCAAFGLDTDQIDVLLDALAAVCRPVRLDFLWRPVLPDPEDDMVLETCVNGAARLLVTFNGRDFAGAERFGVEVLSPGGAVRRLREG